MQLSEGWNHDGSCFPAQNFPAVDHHGMFLASGSDPPIHFSSANHNPLGTHEPRVLFLDYFPALALSAKTGPTRIPAPPLTGLLGNHFSQYWVG